MRMKYDNICKYYHGAGWHTVSAREWLAIVNFAPDLITSRPDNSSSLITLLADPALTHQQSIVHTTAGCSMEK